MNITATNKVGSKNVWKMKEYTWWKWTLYSQWLLLGVFSSSWNIENSYFYVSLHTTNWHKCYVKTLTKEFPLLQLLLLLLQFKSIKMNFDILLFIELTEYKRKMKNWFEILCYTSRHIMCVWFVGRFSTRIDFVWLT